MLCRTELRGPGVRRQGPQVHFVCDSAPAYIEPDEERHVRVNLAGVGAQTYYVDGPDENGVVDLVPVLDHQHPAERDPRRDRRGSTPTPSGSSAGTVGIPKELGRSGRRGGQVVRPSTPQQRLLDEINEILALLEANPRDRRVRQRRYTNLAWRIDLRSADWMLLWLYDEPEHPVVVHIGIAL